jgi:outer membrane protein assembly factor BamB
MPKLFGKKTFIKNLKKKNNPRLFLAIKENRLIVIDSLSNLFLVNLENGNLIWSTKNEYPFNSEIKILNEKFFAVDIKNILRCFYIKDGSECWSLETDKTLTLSNSKNSLIISNKLVVFVNNLGDVTAADIQSGAMVWQLPTQSSAIANSTYSFKNSKLVLDEDEIYFSNNFNEFHSINLNNGSINWINDISSSLTPIIVNSLIFTISENGYLFVIDKKTGNIIKIKDVFKNYKDKDKKKIKPMGFSISQDKVYLTNSDGKLIIIELNSGDIAKVENITRSLISKPFLFNNNLFVIKNGGIGKYE